MPRKKRKHAEIDITGHELDTLVHDFKKERQLIGDIESLMGDAEKLIVSKKNLMLEEMAFEKKLVQQKLNALDKERNKAMLKEIESQRDAMMKEVKKQQTVVQADRDALEAEKEAMKTRDISDEDLLSLNVGGSPFQVLRRTLCMVERSMLASQFSGRWENTVKRDEEGRIFFNWDPDYFKMILRELRECELDPLR